MFLLYPFWGNIPEEADAPDFGRMDDLMLQGKEIYLITDDITNADAGLLPFPFMQLPELKKKANEMLSFCRRHQKPLVIMFNNDDASPLEMEGSIMLRTSLYKSKQKSNEHGLPGWSVDFLKKYKNGELQIRTKQSTPAIGYCGYIDYASIAEKIKKQIKWQLQYSFGKRNPESDKGIQLRGKAVRLLQSSKNMQTNFIIRKGFWGGNMSQQQARLEYAENIFESDYALVVRGAGNFSYRLYEVLSCGRIPIFINTDCVLPYDEFVQWKNYFVWIEENELDRVEEKIINFHNNISPESFVQLQQQIRKLYEEWISPVGYCKNLYRYI